MVMYMFTAEHAENTESQDRCEVLGFRFEVFGLLTSDIRKDKSIKIESLIYREI